MYVNIKKDRFRHNFSKSPVYSLCMTGKRVKRVTSGREKTKERGYTDRCSPTDSSINGFADNLRKYCARQRKYRASVREIRKIRVERALLPSFARNFFPFHPRERERERGNGRKKAEWKWKNREWVHFPRGWELASNPLSFIHHAITVSLPSPFTKSLAVLQSRCIAPSHSTRFLNLRIRRIAADLWICDEFFWYSEKSEMRI